MVNNRAFIMMKFKRVLHESIRSKYLFANVVYFFYATSMLYIDFSDMSLRSKNDMYFYFGIVHVINAFMYIWAWEDRPWYHECMFPEYLNVVGAFLYLASRFFYIFTIHYYGNEYSDGDKLSEGFYYERRLEFCASLLEMMAALGWTYVWYTEYYQKYGRLHYPTSGRGWTFDDPDLTANITIILGSSLYLVYNCQINWNESIMKPNELYIVGDAVFFVNSIFYILAAMRDCGWFWWLPSWGRWVSIEETRERFYIESRDGNEDVSASYPLTTDTDSNHHSV